MFKPKPRVTNLAYKRWLRAQRPQSFGWFMDLSEDDQETLACIGEEYTADVIVTLVEALVGEPAEQDEEQSLRRIAAEAAQRILNGGPTAKPVSMGGITKRKQERVQADQKAKDNSRSFLGQPPNGGEG